MGKSGVTSDSIMLRRGALDEVAAVALIFRDRVRVIATNKTDHLSHVSERLQTLTTSEVRTPDPE